MTLGVAALALALFAFLAWVAHRVTISKHALARHRAWAMRCGVWLRLRPGQGFATAAELCMRWSTAAAIVHGHRARPGLRLWDRLSRPGHRLRGQVRPGTVGPPRVRPHAGPGAHPPPPQAGESGLLADRIIDHPGPVVCTTTREDLFAGTAGGGSCRGRLHTFNPLGIGGVPSTFGWDIIDGCENRHRHPAGAGPDRRLPDRRHEVVAVARPARPSRPSCTPPGCAPGATILDVHGWVNRHGDAMAEEILDGRPGRVLRAAVDPGRDPPRREDRRLGAGDHLRVADLGRGPRIGRRGLPRPGVAFDTPEFVRRNGTLYMIAPGTETAPIAPCSRRSSSTSTTRRDSLARGPRWEARPAAAAGARGADQICRCRCRRSWRTRAGKGVLVAAVMHSSASLRPAGASPARTRCGRRAARRSC